MYEFFEHTADVGLRVRARDLDALFEDAARGLFALITEPLPTEEQVERRFEIAGERHDHLLFDWLNELLYAFDSEQLVFGSFRVRVEPGGLRAVASGVAFDLARHRALHEVKAITYHGLKVERDAEGWCAEVILDI